MLVFQLEREIHVLYYKTQGIVSSRKTTTRLSCRARFHWLARVMQFHPRRPLQRVPYSTRRDCRRDLDEISADGSLNRLFRYETNKRVAVEVFPKKTLLALKIEISARYPYRQPNSAIRSSKLYKRGAANMCHLWKTNL